MINRFQHALHGLAVALRKREVVGHLAAAALVIVLGVFTCLAPSDWMALAFAIGLVLTAEIANTAVEGLADAVSRQPRAGIRRAKDVSAAAVLVAALAAAVIGALVFLPAWAESGFGSCLLSYSPSG